MSYFLSPPLFISYKELFCPIPNCSRSDSNSTKKPFKTFKLLKQHFLIKHQQKSFKCDQCTSHFHDSVALKSHVQVCGKLVCQTCSKSYRATDGLEKHLRAHKDSFQIDALKSIAHWLIERFLRVETSTMKMVETIINCVNSRIYKSVRP